MKKLITTTALAAIMATNALANSDITNYRADEGASASYYDGVVNGYYADTSDNRNFWITSGFGAISSNDDTLIQVEEEAFVSSSASDDARLDLAIEAHEAAALQRQRDAESAPDDGVLSSDVIEHDTPTRGFVNTDQAYIDSLPTNSDAADATLIFEDVVAAPAMDAPVDAPVIFTTESHLLGVQDTYATEYGLAEQHPGVSWDYISRTYRVSGQTFVNFEDAIVAALGFDPITRGDNTDYGDDEYGLEGNGWVSQINRKGNEIYVLEGAGYTLKYRPLKQNYKVEIDGASPVWGDTLSELVSSPRIRHFTSVTQDIVANVTPIGLDSGTSVVNSYGVVSPAPASDALDVVTGTVEQAGFVTQVNVQQMGSEKEFVAGYDFSYDGDSYQVVSEASDASGTYTVNVRDF